MSGDGLVVGSQHVILAYFVAINALYLAGTVFAFHDLVRYRRRLWRGSLRGVMSESSYRPISVLVPAHDERETIVSTVRSLLALQYPEFEIVVTNDGSLDGTLDVLRSEFALYPVATATRVSLTTQPVRATYRSLDHPNLVVIDKQRGGKSDALNAGINASSYPVFCCMDADSVLQPDALLRIARVFAEDDTVLAVGGVVRVLNGSVVEDGQVVSIRTPNRPMVLFQSLEYIRGFLAGRTPLAGLNALLIISGAFGLFRKDPVVAAGGYDTGTVCEDMEIIVRLHRWARDSGRRGRVIFVPDPVCWTEVPSDWRSLLRQRDRWQRGLLESLWKHRTMMLNPRYGTVGLIAMPYYVLFEAIGPVIELCGYALMAGLLVMGMLDTAVATLFFILAVLFGVTLSVMALILDDLLFKRYDRARDVLKMSLAAVLEYAGYRQLLALQRTAAFLTVASRRRSWGEDPISDEGVRRAELGARTGS